MKPRHLAPCTSLAALVLLLAAIPVASWSCSMTRFNGRAMTTGAEAEQEHLATPRARRCPPSGASSLCKRERTWAQDPDTGACCAFDSACEIPAGWTRLSGPSCRN